MWSSGGEAAHVGLHVPQLIPPLDHILPRPATLLGLGHGSGTPGSFFLMAHLFNHQELVFGWSSLLSGRFHLSQTKASSALLDMAHHVQHKLGSTFLWGLGCSYMSLTSEFPDSDSVISSLALAHLYSSTKLGIGSDRAQFPWRPMLVRHLGNPSHFLTWVITNLSHWLADDRLRL